MDEQNITLIRDNIGNSLHKEYSVIESRGCRMPTVVGEVKGRGGGAFVRGSLKPISKLTCREL